MDWESIVYYLKKINLDHLGERSLLLFRNALDEMLKKVNEEVERRIG